MALTMSLADRIVLARRARGWNSAKLAAEAGISRQQMSKIENGRAIPRDSTLKRICDVLDLDPDQHEQPRARAVDMLFDRMTPKDQAEILDLMAERVAKAQGFQSFLDADEPLAFAAR